MNHEEQVAQNNEVFKRITGSKRDAELDLSDAIQEVVNRLTKATGVDVEDVSVTMENCDTVGARSPRKVTRVELGLGLPGRLVK